MSPALVNLLYLAAAVLFIVSLKMMTHPRTASNGNLVGALGMLLAVVVTLFDKRIVSFEVIIAGLIAGSLFGAVVAWRAPMTAMPQLVAVFNGLGGGASALAVGASLEETFSNAAVKTVSLQLSLSAAAAALVGAVTLTGSFVAYAKLQGLIDERPVLLPARHLINGALAAGCVALSYWLVVSPDSALAFWLLIAASGVLGVLVVIPIGGADMPVVISLLNCYSGIAAAAYGWVLNNNALIIAGSLVGAAGFILTAIMSKAMNRSLTNIMFAGLGTVAAGAAESDKVYAGRVKSTSPDEAAILLSAARKVVVVPGYGMAVAQAQFGVHDLMKKLEERGVDVQFAIHPVAGRMPGHMNVLLADAGIPYDKLKEMDEINPMFRQVDVVLVIGANDVVNPLARQNDPSVPIAGMPILDVDQARSVIIVKRSLSPGFAGIPNPLFAADNALMLFADANKAVLDILTALKEQ
ncbi:MAG: NAD(P)(+) transhydrogenase (Re/Si-specific) subunit beta [Planctomycetia bacterium]|nr:NAD(P)(+) transhydrogenase (Re/Si-specific) subunit beta [Planctomycetia bacterium]